MPDDVGHIKSMQKSRPLKAASDNSEKPEGTKSFSQNTTLLWRGFFCELFGLRLCSSFQSPDPLRF
jgi:hypothetical protein